MNLTSAPAGDRQGGERQAPARHQVHAEHEEHQHQGVVVRVAGNRIDEDRVPQEKRYAEQHPFGCGAPQGRGDERGGHGDGGHAKELEHQNVGDHVIAGDARELRVRQFPPRSVRGGIIPPSDVRIEGIVLDRLRVRGAEIERVFAVQRLHPAPDDVIEHVGRFDRIQRQHGDVKGQRPGQDDAPHPAPVKDQR